MIEDPIRERTYQIPCNAWLSSRSKDQKTTRDFQVTSVVSHKTGSSSKGKRKDTGGFLPSSFIAVSSSLDFREDLGSQSGYSTATTEGTISSTSTNRSQTRYSNHMKRSKKSYPKRPRSTNVKSKEDPSARPSTAAVSAGRPHSPARSPVITRSSSSSSDTTIADKVAHRSLSPITPRQPSAGSPSSLKRSVVHRTSEPSIVKDETPRASSPSDFDRPPARLENRPPSPASPVFKRAPKTTAASDEDYEDSFFN